MSGTSAKISKRPDWLLPALGLLMFVAALWLPFGLKRPDRMEGWVLFNHLEQQNSPISQNLDGTGRPLVLLTWFIAHLIDPNSFLGAHLVLIGLLFGKSLTFYLLLRHGFEKSKGFAFLAGALLTVYPADTGLVDTRIINIHSAVFFYILAVYFLVRSWPGQHPALLIASALIVTASLATYEAGYPLVLLTPLLLLMLGKPIRWRKWLRTTAIWYLGPLLYAVYWLHVRSGLPVYQENLLHIGPLGFDTLRFIAEGVLHAYWQTFWNNWSGPLQQPQPYLALAVLIVLGVAGCAGILARSEPVGQVRWGLAGVGLCVVLLGYAPFALTSLRLETWRVYLYPALGAVLVVTVLADWVASRFRLHKIILIGLMVPLIGIGVLSTFNEQQRFDTNSLAQQQILSGLIRQAPKIAPNTLILLIDDPAEQGAIQAFWANFYFESAVRFVYADQTLRARICYPTLPTWGDWQDRCQLTDQQVLIEGGGFNQKLFQPYNRVVAFKYSSTDGAVLLWQIPSVYGAGSTAYDPGQLIDLASPAPRRAWTLFPVWPVPSASPSLAPIADGQTLALGSGWYPPESDGQRRFQWVQNDAEFVIGAQPTPTAQVEIEVGPGPGLAYGPFWLDVLDSEDHVITAAHVETQQMINLRLPTQSDRDARYRLHIEGGGQPTPGDHRILNFRVFGIRLRLPVF